MSNNTTQIPWMMSAQPRVIVCAVCADVFFRTEQLNLIILGCALIIQGICVVLFDIVWVPTIATYCHFYFTFAGRGLYYIFIASLFFNDNQTLMLIGSILGYVLGFLYLLTACLKFLPFPMPFIKGSSGGSTTTTTTTARV